MSARQAVLALLLIVATALPVALGGLLANGCPSAPSRWFGVVSSTDGNVLTATDGLVVYRSTNAGATWRVPAAANGPVGGGWRALACDATGTRLYGSTGSHLHISVDGGATWNLGFTWHEADVWPQLSVSANGSIVLAGTSFLSFSGGKVYRSTGGGREWTWNEITPWPPGTNVPWGSAKVSSDGSTMAAGPSVNGNLYVARVPAYWAARRPDNTTNNAWYAAALSADGSRVVAVSSNGVGFDFSSKLFYSTNFGASWTPTTTVLPYPRAFPSIAASADGTRLVMASWRNIGGGTVRGTLYTSSNSGAAWQAAGEDVGWYSVASSSSGKNLVAAPFGSGTLYTSTDFGASWVPCGANVGRRRLRTTTH